MKSARRSSAKSEDSPKRRVLIRSKKERFLGMDVRVVTVYVDDESARQFKARVAELEREASDATQ